MPTPSPLLMRHRFWVLNGALVLALAGSAWGSRTANLEPTRTDFLRPLSLPFRGWKTADVPVSDREKDLLRPDAVLVRRYAPRDGGENAPYVELAVVAGHRKQTVHTPAFCMAGGGWETLSRGEAKLEAGAEPVLAVQTLMARGNAQLLATYYFTDGEFSTRSLVQYQGLQMLKRFRSEPPLGALVRITVPVGEGGPDAARKTTEEFARTVLPGVMQTLRSVRREGKGGSGGGRV